MALVDENTIGVIGILGSTYTGEYEPIAELDAALSALCAAHNGKDGKGGGDEPAGDEDGWVWDVPLHVDAASGGFVAPFLTPELLWDFRLARVRSINVSGHKYGLVYPGVGWVIWRESSDLPKELIFEVDYLGGSHANFGLNFSRGAAQIVAQYYNLIRLGRRGYTEIMESLSETSRWLATELGKLAEIEIVRAGRDLPVVCLGLADDVPFSVFDLSDRLRLRGWVVPAYRMAADAESVAVLRIVVREGLSRDMAQCLVEDVVAALTHLRSLPPDGPAAADPLTPTVDNPASAAAASLLAGAARVPGEPHGARTKADLSTAVDPKTKAVC
jgi:glutamate decarboxylase